MSEYSRKRKQRKFLFLAIGSFTAYFIFMMLGESIGGGNSQITGFIGMLLITAIIVGTIGSIVLSSRRSK